jgi:prolyl oligopeptidase
MARFSVLTLPLVLIFSTSTVCAQQVAIRSYPSAPKVKQVDNYFGTLVPDPYRWLEDPDSKQTSDWVTAENRLTFDYLQKIPQRGAIKERLTKVYNYERYGVPFQQKSNYFLTKNSGLQNQSVLYVTADLSTPPRVLLDPNTLSADGTVALGGTSVSDDGKLLAYSTSASGSDWQEWRVRDVATGKDLDDLLKWSKFSGASWLKDSSGFFYSRYDEPQSATQFKDANYYQKLYFHKMGTPQSQDVLVYERKDHKEWFFSGTVSDDGRYLIISVGEGTDPKNRVFYKDLKVAESKVVELIPESDAAYTFIDNDGSTFWFLTDKDALRGRVVAIDTTKPLALQEIIPQSKDTLTQVSCISNQFIAVYLKDAHSQVETFDLMGKALKTLPLPGIGSVNGFPGKRSDKETFFAYESFATPDTIYRYDLETGTSSPLFKPQVKFNPDDFTTEQVFYKSKDGTQIPMFITAKKGFKRDSVNPTLLYGYGGFGASLSPIFKPENLVWMEMGGIYAVPNLRGGGEYGEAWHQAGTKLKKQNVFDDFIAAAEWLIVNQYTSTPKLAIAGRSNGGLLVGAALTQRPELFGAALPAVGVMDMLRFQKFTIGWAWTSDYGSSENPEQFKALYAYSPLHNVKSSRPYPATLVTTGDHDDRVVPGHSFKFAAALQAAQKGTAPVLIRIDTKAGHGVGKPTSKLIEESADRWAFLVKALKMQPKF